MKVTGRIGLTSTSETDYKGSPSSSTLGVDYLKSKLTGKVNDVLNYTLVSKWTTNAFIDEAFVTRSLMDGTSLSFGKMGILIGGREFDYSSADLFRGFTF